MKFRVVLLTICAYALTAAIACCAPDPPKPDPPIETSAEEILPIEPAVQLTQRDGLTFLSIQNYEMLLVNKTYHLPSSYGDGIPSETQAVYDRMAEAARAAGYPIWIVSGYRSYETQADLFARNVKKYGSEQEANKVSARAGESEHQTGLALDLAGAENEILTFEFADTPTGQWLNAHCAEYGFILRYPDGKTWATGYVFEPWHFRYVGVELAKILTDSGLSVEEYAGLV